MLKFITNKLIFLTRVKERRRCANDNSISHQCRGSRNIFEFECEALKASERETKACSNMDLLGEENCVCLPVANETCFTKRRLLFHRTVIGACLQKDDDEELMV